MKILVPQHSLSAAFTPIQRIIQSKPQLPVLSMVKIEAKKGVIHLYATDLVVGIHTMLLADVVKEGACVVPAKNLSALISSLSQETIELVFESGKLQVKTDSLTTTFHTGVIDEFPDFPITTGQKIKFSKEILGKITKLVALSVAKDQVRPVLASVFIATAKDHIDIVGTDGFRLSLLQQSNTSLPVENVLIPAKSLLEIEKIAQTSDIDLIEMQVSLEEQSLLCTIGKTMFFSRLISGDYPPYTKIVPSEFTTTVRLQRQSLEDNVKRSLLFSQQEAAFIQLELTPEGVKLSSKNTLGEVLAADVVSRDFKGEASVIAFNSRYVLDYLKIAEDEYVDFSMTEPLRPAQFSSVSQPEFIYIVMPFRAR